LIGVFPLNAQKLPELIPYREGRLFGYCDSNLNVVVKAKYDKAYPFIEGRGMVEQNYLKGFVDLNGKEIAPCIHKFATRFEDGYALVGSSRESAQYIDKSGQGVAKENPFSSDLHPPIQGLNRSEEYKNRTGPIKDGIYFYRKNLSEGYVTVDGDTISGSEFEYPFYSESYSTTDEYDSHFQHFYEERAVVSGTNRQGHIDTKGHLVVDTVYEAAFNFKEGRAKVKLNGKYGFIDKEGKVVGEIKYDQASYFYDGMAQVIIGEKCGYIDLEGREVVPLEYDYWQGELYSSFKNGLARVRINDKYGVVDKNGNRVTPIKYDDVSYFYHNHSIVRFNDRFGLIDEEGNEVIPLIYSSLSWMDRYALLFELELGKREYGLINTLGEVLVSNEHNSPSREEGSTGIYKIVKTTQDFYFIDHYGTTYIKK